MRAFSLDDFDYPLPRELIAERPLEPREAARLLLIPAAGECADRHVADLPEVLRPGDLLVCNDTKVIPARLVGRRGAARVELTLHREEGGGAWRAFAKGARRLKPGDTIEFAGDFAATVISKHPEGDLSLRFAIEGEAFRSALGRHGAMPLPPYIKRPAGGDPRDRADYQTMFASVEGAVAAPTAGLHFTPALVARLNERGIGLAGLTLHVGPGTFLPVKETDPSRHNMHAEWGIVPAETAARIAAAKRAGGRIVAIGTTSLRLLETAADEKGEVHPFAGETRLFILPGYRFRAIDLLLTNFHLPRSTLLMLVAALAGLDRIRAAYAHAVANRYRFFSYGDACLIEHRANDRKALSPPSGAEKVGVRWGTGRASPAAAHLTLPTFWAGPLPLPPRGGEGQQASRPPLPTPSSIAIVSIPMAAPARSNARDERLRPSPDHWPYWSVIGTESLRQKSAAPR